MFDNKHKIIKNSKIFDSTWDFDQCYLINNLTWIARLNYLMKINSNYV